MIGKSKSSCLSYNLIENSLKYLTINVLGNFNSLLEYCATKHHKFIVYKHVQQIYNCIFVILLKLTKHNRKIYIISKTIGDKTWNTKYSSLWLNTISAIMFITFINPLIAAMFSISSGIYACLEPFVPSV